MAFVRRRKSDFCAVQTHFRANKSGGRKPPVVTQTRLQRRPPTHRSAVLRAIAEAPVRVRFPIPRRAYARRSWFGSPYSADMIRCALQVRLRTTHGGLTPAAPGARRSLGGEKATFAMHESISAETGARGLSSLGDWASARKGRRLLRCANACAQERGA